MGNKHEEHHTCCACSCKEEKTSCGCGNSQLFYKPERIIVRLIVGSILFVTGILVKFRFSSILFYGAYLILGYDVLIRCASNILRGKIFDENFLMGIATLGAAAIGEVPEAVGVMLFYQLGEFLQNIAVNRSRKSIADLMNIRPEYANLKKGEKFYRAAPEEVHIGDIIAVKAGEKIPLDGVVVEGSASVDMSALSGESAPVDVGEGSVVFSGGINTNGLLIIKVEKEFGDSAVSRILKLVEDAAEKKSRSEKFITVFARHYTPVVVMLAAIVALIPPLFTHDGLFAWVYRALTFLVISCPCALVVSVPLGFFSGIGCASRAGILIKGSNSLEDLSKIGTVVFDKTGTLTKGVFEVSDIKSNIGKERLLEVAAHAEYYSNHPIASCIVKAYRGKIREDAVFDYKEMPGLGISVTVDGKAVLAGNEKLMHSENIAFEKNSEAGSVVYIAVDRAYAGSIIISDQIKSDAALAVQSLKNAKIKTAMLTGDNRASAEYVGENVHIDEIWSQLFPEDKVRKVEELLGKMPKEKKLAFVGDGINDAPVLARADIGIAMGGLGSDAAIEAADMVIMNDEPSKITDAIRISKKTMRITWQNIIFALGIKALIMFLSVLGYSSMWLAVFADTGVALLAVFNSLRAFSYRNTPIN
ncbi:MAG: heavy metal translocating P-type ATPase [Clostridia bacterium]|nr:heavy metal translocating P-type ATPase [Clostridia bacterium]